MPAPSSSTGCSPRTTTMCSSTAASKSPITTTQVHCAGCGHMKLNSIQIAVQCYDSQGYHKSRCAYCLLEEMHDCCLEITGNTMATIEDYIDFKHENTSKHAQKSTDFAIINFLEYALCSRILVDDVPDNNTQVTHTPAQDPSPGSTLQSYVYRQSSPELETYDGDSETTTISGDLSEHTSHAITNNSATPEDLPNDFHDSLSPPYNVSMTYNETLNDKEMFELADQDPDEVIHSVEWEY